MRVIKIEAWYLCKATNRTHTLTSSSWWLCDDDDYDDNCDDKNNQDDDVYDDDVVMINLISMYSPHWHQRSSLLLESRVSTLHSLPNNKIGEGDYVE